ncbi:TonB-dependent receptor [Pokkaliibacter sp. CJK22405]|uniref:TonB-dependent receptor n=1 Tax=Pokkaliibacter sp. CJK22405 TaxID=3384615 RepID=UPI003984C6E2
MNPTSVRTPGIVARPHQQRMLTTAAIGIALSTTPLMTYADTNDTSTSSTGKTTLVLPALDIVADEESGPAGQPDSVKYTQPLLDTAKTVNVIDQKTIKSQGATSLRDVLRNVTGISIQAGEGGTPAGDNLSIRGFNARTDIYVDGVRDMGTYTRDSYNLEQVEVAKGPSSSMSGRGSTGGSVTLVSKTPKQEDFTDISLGLGTSDYRRGTLDTNQTFGESNAFRLNVMGLDTEVAGRDLVNNKRWGFAPSVSFGLGTETRVTLSYEHLKENNLPDYGIPWVPSTNTALAGYANEAPPVDFDNFYGLADRDYEDISSDGVKLLAEHDLSDNATLRNQLSYQRTVRDSIVTAPRFVSDSSTDIRRELKGRNQIDTIVDNQTDLALHFDTAGYQHDLVTGVQLTRETEETNTRNVSNSADLADLYDPNAYDDYATVPDKTENNIGKTTTQSLYVNDTLHLSPQWILNGGLRADHSSTKYEVNTASRSTAVGTYDNSDTTLSYQAGITYKPLPNGSVYLAYGTSFNPSAEGLSLSSSTENLKPEKNVSLELGTKWNLLDERVMLSAAVFRTDKTNARETDPDDSSLYVMNGEQRVQGVELGASGYLTPSWQLMANYTYMDSEVRSATDEDIVGNELSNTPHNSFSLWSSYQLTSDLQLGGGLQYVDDRFNSTSNTRVAPSYTLYSAAASYTVNSHLTLRLNLHNITDEDYIDSVGGGHFIPGTGRYGTLTADMSF